MKESERLIAAKKLIDEPEKWMQGSYSNSLGYFKDATCFCSLGAVHKVRTNDIRELDYNSTSKYLKEACQQLSPQSFGDVAGFNDNNTHEAVMEMFDVAIKIAQDEGN